MKTQIRCDSHSKAIWNFPTLPSSLFLSTSRTAFSEMTRKSSTNTYQSSSINQKSDCRRVSFDLAHNTIYILPTLEECKESARQRGREEWERRQLNEEMLCESIILEIQQANTSHTVANEEPQQPQLQVLKSCLKKATPTPEPSPRKKHKKGKRNNSNHNNSRSRFPGGCSNMETWVNPLTIPIH